MRDLTPLVDPYRIEIIEALHSRFDPSASSGPTELRTNGN